MITPVEPDKGLAALPEPSAGDVFFDLEGDAFATDGGLEYLFGAADRDGGYDAHWALDQQTEKRVFESFIDRVMVRWQQHPGFHIYHYGAYETTAVKRLMSRYATREEEVDRCCAATCSSTCTAWCDRGCGPLSSAIRSRSWSRSTVSPAGSSSRPQRGRSSGSKRPWSRATPTARRTGCATRSKATTATTASRRCASPNGWRRARQELQDRTGQPVPRPALRDEERDQERASAAEIAALFETLTAGLPVDDAELNNEQQARRLLAHLLEFHRREEKSMWWEFFDRCGFTEEEHVEIGRPSGR